MIIGAKEVECECLDEIMSLLETGSSVRHTGSTQMNEHSSRSHSIFTVVVGLYHVWSSICCTGLTQNLSHGILASFATSANNFFLPAMLNVLKGAETIIIPIVYKGVTFVVMLLLFLTVQSTRIRY